MTQEASTRKRKKGKAMCDLPPMHPNRIRICLDFTVNMFLMDFSVCLRLFLAPLPSRFLQIDHYLLHPESANLLKNPSQLNSK